MWVHVCESVSLPPCLHQHCQGSVFWPQRLTEMCWSLTSAPSAWRLPSPGLFAGAPGPLHELPGLGGKAGGKTLTRVFSLPRPGRVCN